MNKTDFKIEGTKLTVTRTFNAKQEKVWQCFTVAEHLDQWWAPKPWRSETSDMNFVEGGSRLYAMVSPENERHYGKTIYTTINAKENFSGSDVFCDEKGIVNPDMPAATFINHFNEDDAKTTVVMVTTYPTEKQLTTVIEMGMKEGLSMAYENLDSVLESL